MPTEKEKETVHFRKYTSNIRKHLIGRTITDVKWLSADESKRLMDWDYQPCEIFLDNGTILTPGADDEGNNAGVIFTNIKEIPIHFKNRTFGKSKIPKAEIFRTLKNVFYLKFFR